MLVAQWSQGPKGSMVCRSCRALSSADNIRLAN